MDLLTVTLDEIGTFVGTIISNDQDYDLLKDMLSKSTFEGNDNVVTLIVNPGCENNIGVFGTTVLHIACAYFNSKLVELLLDRGADMYAGVAIRRTPIVVLKEYYTIYKREQMTLRIDSPENLPPYEEVLKILKLFFSKGFVMNATNSIDRNVVECLFIHGTKEVVDLIAEHGYDLNYVNDSDGQTILQKLVVSGTEAIIEALVKHVDVDLRTRHGTALHVAAREAKVENARVLLDNGADVDATHNEFATPFILAISLNARSSDMCRFLLRYRSSITSIISHVSGMRLVLYTCWRSTEFRDQQKIIVQHAVALKAANFPVDDGLYAQMVLSVKEFFKVPDYRKECEAELKQLSTKRITVGRNLDQLMKGHRNNVAWWLNKEVQNYMESRQYEGAFPIYSDTLAIAYRLALKRRKILETNGLILFHLFFGVGLIFDVAIYIIDCWTDDDIMSFVGAYALYVRHKKIHSSLSAASISTE